MNATHFQPYQTTDSPDGHGLSNLPTLIGEDAAGHAQIEHDFLYWEYRGQTAVRRQHWKAIQPKTDADWELYDLRTDLSEQQDVAAEHPASATPKSSAT